MMCCYDAKRAITVCVPVQRGALQTSVANSRGYHDRHERRMRSNDDCIFY
jgi:hypothetical protein